MDKSIEMFIHRVTSVHSKNTADSYTAELHAIFPDDIPVLTEDFILSRITIWKSNGNSVNTIAHRLIVLKQYLCNLREKPVDYNRLLSLCKSVKTEEHVEIPLSPDDIQRVLDVMQGDIKYITIFLLMSHQGLRISETANLSLGDYFDNCIVIRKPKNKKEEILKISNKTKEMLDLWIRYKKPMDNMFNTSASGIYKGIKRYFGMVGLDSYHPHSARRYFCQRLVDSDIPLPIVQKCMRHKTVATTMRYFAINDKLVYNAMDSVFN